jgi:hypothetical protein
MANRYLGELQDLLNQTHPDLAAAYELEFKNVFGAVAAYVNGHIFVSCGQFGVALRLPPNTLDSLFQETGVERLRYFPKGHIKKQYAVLPDRIIRDRTRFRALVDECIAYALPDER